MRWALDGEWTLSGAGFTVSDLNLPVSVPRALAQAGIIEQCDTGLAPLHDEWIYRRRWTLRKTLSVHECTQERLILSLPALVGCGEIFINSVHTADFDGAMELEVTQCLENGVCEIEIMFDGMRECRPFGLGSGAQLRGVNCLRLTQAQVSAGDTAIRAFVQTEAYVPGTYVFRYAFEQAGNALGSVEFEQRLGAGHATMEHLIEMEDELSQAQRWREGIVNAPLHVRLLVLRRGEACDAALFRTGLRRIDRAQSAPGLCACVCGIDGRKTALMGAVYEPIALESVHPGKVVAQARAAGMTALYVSGCADEAFYDACDVQGMMIFQELPTDAAAAERMIAMLGVHPCIVQWGCAPVRGTQGRMTDLLHPVLSALTEALNRRADERPFVGALCTAEGTGAALHVCGPAQAHGPEAMTRFFDQDTAAYRTVRLPALRYGKELQAVSGGMDAWSAEGQEGRGALWALRGGMWPPADRLELRDFIGEDIWADAEKLSLITHFLQAETVRYALECTRMRDAAGFFAQRLGGEKRLLCDDLLISPDGREKEAYHAFAQAMKPVHVCARLDRTAFWTQTHLDAFVRVAANVSQSETAQIEAALYRGDGTLISRETFSCTLDTGEYGCMRAQLPDEPGALVLRLTLRTVEKVVDQTDYVLSVGLAGPLWPLVHLPSTTLEVRGGAIENTGAFVAYGVSAPGLGWRCVLPGERVTFAGMSDEVQCMNALFV